MLEHLIETWLPEVYAVIEIFGIIIIAIGSIKAFMLYFASFIKKKRYPIKIELANALALGLEFKMGAEILKTVLIHEMSEIYVLGAIILLRAILTLLIHFEIKAELKHGIVEKEEASTDNY